MDSQTKDPQLGWKTAIRQALANGRFMQPDFGCKPGTLQLVPEIDMTGIVTRRGLARIVGWCGVANPDLNWLSAVA